VQLKLINTSGFAQFTFSIDSHKLRVVALDGIAVRPSGLLSAVVLNAGQRVTVLVCPARPRRRPGSWQPAWIRAHMIQVWQAGDRMCGSVGRLIGVNRLA